MNIFSYWRWVADRLVSIESKLDQVIGRQGQEGRTIMSVQGDVAALVTEVTKQTNITAGVSTLLEQLTAMLAAMAANTTDPATAAALSDAVATLTANDGKIAAAVQANTPQPPAPAPAPAPTPDPAPAPTGRRR